uniref:Uncharacterized protein n=1 Tax=Solanum lycopersicum TaxID=4081 RepID=A0A3Q7EFJ1_SOLLC
MNSKELKEESYENGSKGTYLSTFPITPKKQTLSYVKLPEYD